MKNFFLSQMVSQVLYATVIQGINLHKYALRSSDMLYFIALDMITQMIFYDRFGELNTFGTR
jgi:hypothetical protein